MTTLGNSAIFFSELVRTNFTVRASRGCGTRTFNDKSRQRVRESHVDVAWQMSGAVKLAKSPGLPIGNAAVRFFPALVMPAPCGWTLPGPGVTADAWLFLLGR